jgi:DNA topoisomerase VI subunit A
VQWTRPNGEPQWMVVVEKEGVFHRLLEEQFPE